MKKIFLLFTAFALNTVVWGQTTVIENCEANQTLLGTKWLAYSAGTSTILINGKAIDGITDLETSSGGNGGNGSCMSASGTLTGAGNPFYESAGILFPLTNKEALYDGVNSLITNSSEVSLNLSAAEGIEFYYKSTGSKLVLQVQTTNVKQNRGYDYQIELPDAADWTKFTVAFPGSQLEADGVPVLYQPTWIPADEAKTWDGSTVYLLQWQVRDVNGEYSFSIDDISIIGEILPTDVTPNSISQEINGNTIYFSKLSPTTVSVMASPKYFGDIVLPDTITFEGVEYIVTNIKNNAFAGCTNLTSITIPNTVTSIGDSTFAGCANLTSISIPNSVISIGDGAFQNCESITSIEIPNSVTSIGNTAFVNCSNLITVSLPNSISNIGNTAFYGCIKLQNISIPNNLTTIETATFGKCSSLTNITIPNSVTNIKSGAFSECTGLTSIIIPSSVEDIEGGAFAGSDNINSIVIENPNFNANSSFTINKNLQNITIPASLINSEFYLYNLGGMTPQLKSVTITGGEVTEKGFDNLRLSYRTLETINLINTSNASIPDVALENCYKLKEVLLPQNLETIGYKSFYECVNIKNITIPNSVVSIGDRAFEDCRSMDTLTFGTPLLKAGGSALQTIGNWSFYNCHELKSLTIPEGVTEIGDAAFFSCTYVEQLNLPSSLLKIGDNAFAECENLTNLTILAQTPPQIESKTFFNVNRLIPVFVPNASTLKYSSDTYWSEFVTYKDAPTAISVVSEELDIRVVNGKLQINNPTNKPVNIYNALGQKVSLENATKGMFIIQIGNQQQKVVL